MSLRPPIPNQVAVQARNLNEGPTDGEGLARRLAAALRRRIGVRRDTVGVKKRRHHVDEGMGDAMGRECEKRAATKTVSHFLNPANADSSSE